MTQQFTATKKGFMFYNWNQIQNKLGKQQRASKKNYYQENTPRNNYATSEKYILSQF